MKVLRKGMKDSRTEDDVKKWQYFLRGLTLYEGVVDGDFGPATEAATIAFQKKYMLATDGVVANKTYARAFDLGFCPLTDNSVDKYSQNWPPPPDFKPLNAADRAAIFGKFDFVHAPSQYNPEGIRILGDWQKENLVKIAIPQLIGVDAAPKDGKIFWHKKAVDQILGLFQAWEDADLLHLIETWGGSWNPRFIRGSRSVLSNHAWSTAFDCNVQWNMLGRLPALVGKLGSVRELVPLANEWGFFWGGNFGGGRTDGMHFEVAFIK